MKWPANVNHAENPITSAYNRIMRIASCFWLEWLLVLISACGAASAQACPPDGASNAALITFLRTAKERSSSDICVVKAIKQLQYAHSQKAVDVLIKYLDLRRDRISEEVETGSNSEAYPAISSLSAIGKSALPALTSVVGDSGFTRTAQDNAVRAIMIINRDHPADGISLLMREAQNSEDSARKALFSQAVILALRWCLGKDQNECESVLSDTNNP